MNNCYADIYGSHFIYANTSSQVYRLIIANVSTDRQTKISGSIDGVYVFSKNAKKRYLVDDDYNNFPISFEIEFVTEDESCLTSEERRSIEKWLFNKHNFQKFYIDASDDISGEMSEYVDGSLKKLYLNCRFINPERLEYNGGIVGYRATLEADSGMWWQDSITKTYNFGTNTPRNSPTNISVKVNTDISGYVYPKITIVTGNYGGNITIKNMTDDYYRVTEFSGLPSRTNIFMNCELDYIQGQYYGNFVGQNFPRLLNGSNTFQISGDIATISFEFNNRRML